MGKTQNLFTGSRTAEGSYEHKVKISKFETKITKGESIISLVKLGFRLQWLHSRLSFPSPSETRSANSEMESHS